MNAAAGEAAKPEPGSLADLETQIEEAIRVLSHLCQRYNEAEDGPAQKQLRRMCREWYGKRDELLNLYKQGGGDDGAFAAGIYDKLQVEKRAERLARYD